MYLNKSYMVLLMTSGPTSGQAILNVHIVLYMEVHVKYNLCEKYLFERSYGMCG